MNATRHDIKMTCPVCSAGVLRYKVQESRFDYRGETLIYRQPGAWCSKCGEAVLSGEDMAATENKLVDFMKKVDRAQAEELSRIRRKLKLTQKQAATLTGGGHNAFSRYERGEAKPLPAVIHLFRLLDGHPELLTELMTKKDRAA